MLSLGGILLGIINILIVVAILMLIGAVIIWVMGALGWQVTQLMIRLYVAVVALIALYMLVSLLLGVPTIHLIGHPPVA
ncbi:MAG: hypothetical protein J2P55_07410 [Rhizobiales bacterium]|nr:hypothetical protein [Hyphomicrobiales bacterium]